MKLCLTIISIIALGVVTLSGCGDRDAPQLSEGEARAVKTTVVQSNEIVRTEQVPGSVRAAIDASLESKLSGRVVKMLVKESEVVQAGQTLVVLDSKEVKAKLDQAIAAEKQAQQDLGRFAKLLPSGAVKRQDYEAVEARAEVSRAAVVEARAMLDYTTVVAPFAGVITKRLAEEGDLALPGKSLLKIERQDLYRFEANIPESLLSELKLGATTRIAVSGIEGEIDAVVSEISPTTDAASRTLLVKFDLKSQPSIRSGQFGYVSVPLKKRKELKIPEGALLERGQLEMVFVANGDRANLRLVRSGKRDGTGIEILSGLSEGEKIVTEEISLLRDGDKISERQ